MTGPPTAPPRMSRMRTTTLFPNGERREGAWMDIGTMIEVAWEPEGGPDGPRSGGENDGR